MTASATGRRPFDPSEGAFGKAFPSEHKSPHSRDALESFFSGWENLFCAPKSVDAYAKDTLQEEPDVFDYVFEQVESFTCAEESPHNEIFLPKPPQPQWEGDNSYHKGELEELKRENSLVEKGPNGQVHYVATQQEGDMLDYVFEHVESFVCNDDSTLGTYDTDYTSSKNKGSTPRRNTTNNQNRQRRSPESSHPIPRDISFTSESGSPTKRKKKRRQKKKQNYYPDEEDNILLYYRPEKA